MQQSLDTFQNMIPTAILWYELLSEAPWWPLAGWIVSIVASSVALVRVWFGFQQYLLKRRAVTATKMQDEELRLHWFRDQDFVSATRDYLVPYCSNVDPSDREDLRNTVAVREHVLNALDRELSAEDKRHILVLADSGMGKTTLLLNLVAREQRRKEGRRRRFALVPLGEADALERLDTIPKKRETILLLDAFDEDPRAIEDAALRMETLMNAAAPFKCVVMTCRTQFFPSDEELPRQTGIKRVAARRAGTPVIYQWLTVYLQPFDRQQINQYVRRAIPWRKLEQRKKAQRIIADISDLAARPMLTALIPSLAASKREAHSLWDLYAFMVDTWIQRESAWIEPEALQRMSQSIAVELVLNRSSRGAERMSRGELIELVGIEGTAMETWKLTSRSLLNRDADGFYKFAHRSILEFFFIKALLEGEKRCMPVRWTDMMCDLFLSWGSSTCTDDKVALHLLSGDFRATGLFPVVERHQPSVKIDSHWAKKVFSDRGSSSARAKFPNSWRSAVAHHVERSSTLRAYDIADGLVWQVDITQSIDDRDDRKIYRYDRYSLLGIDAAGREWAVIDLYELKLLCDILATKSILQGVLDDRELYWLADTDGIYSTLARIRLSQSGEALTYPDLELVQSCRNTISPSYTIDVYRVPTRGMAVGHLQAMAITAHYGEAAVLLEEDNQLNPVSSWGIKREIKLQVQQRSKNYS